MEVLLDTSFIVSSVMKRIDFLEELKNIGLKPVLPREVLQELKDLKMKKKTSRLEREAIDIAFEMFERNKLKKTKLGGKNVDEGLIAKGREGSYIATLDRVIKVKVPNKVVIDAARNSVRVVRD